MKKVIWLMTLMVTIIGCHSTDEIEGVINIPEGQIMELNVGVDGGTKTFKIESNYNWSASTNSEWITITPAQGTVGDTELTITVGESYDEREGFVTITNEKNISSEIKVTQTRFTEPGESDYFATHLTLERYEDNNFIWKLAMYDPNYLGYGSEKSEAIFITMTLDNTHSYGNVKGIPEGLYEIGTTSVVGGAQAVRSVKENYETNDIPFEKGIVEIKKNEQGQAIIGFILQDNEGNKTNAYYTLVENEFNQLLNKAYKSTISRDINVSNYPQATIMKLGDYLGTGKNLWNLILADENLKIKYVGPHEGASKHFTLTLVTPLNVDSPEGEYIFVKDQWEHFDYTAIKGSRPSFAPKLYIYSWWINQSDANVNIEDAPIEDGKVTIVKQENGDYSINITGLDDALPSPNTISAVYNGPLTIFDPEETGDFATSNAIFFGPFEYPSENMNWFIGVGNEEYKNTYGWTGESIVFDVMARPDQYMSNGAPLGTYTIESSVTFNPGTVVFAEHRVHKGETLDKIALVSGSITFSEMPDGRNRITIDARDAAGKEYKGEYYGTVGLIGSAMPPYKSYTMGSNVFAEFRYNGNKFPPTGENPVKNAWDLYFADENSGNPNGKIGISFALELRTSEPTSIETGIPSGRYNLYGPENENIDKGIRSGNYTFYTVAYEGTRSDRIITGGYIDIENKGDGSYSANLKFIMANSEVSFNINGSFSGTPYIRDASLYNTSKSVSRKSVSKDSDKATSIFRKK